MKIAFLSFSYLPKIGGYQIFMHNLMQGLSVKGHAVDLYLPRKAYKFFLNEGLDVSYNVKPLFYLEGKLSKFSPILLTNVLKRVQKQNNYDIWQVVGAFPAAYILAPLAAKVPIVLRSYGEDIQKENSINYGITLDEKIERKVQSALKQITCMVALSDSMKQAFLALGADSTKIVDIPNGINTERFGIDVDRKILRDSYGIQEGESLLITTGRYHIKKGFDYIPETAANLKMKGLNFKWLLIGGGVKRLQEKVKLFGVEENVILIEGIGIRGENLDDRIQLPSIDLLKLYKSADIFVLPSLIEGLSNVILEGMAAGLCVVTTDAPGCRDAIDNGVNGLLVKTKSIADLTEKLSSVILDEKLSESLANSALQKIKSYSWNKIIEKYNDLYIELISNRALEKLK